MSYITLSQEERVELNRNIMSFDSLSEPAQEETQIKLLKLMDSYIWDLAYKYSKKVRGNSLTKNDFVLEMQNTVLKKIKGLKLEIESNKKQIEAYLYYWLNDTCQRLIASMNGPISYSSTTHKKGLKGEIKIAISTSLNNKTEDEKTTFEEALSNGRNPLDELVAKKSAKEFEDIIIKKFGKQAYEVFYKKYCLGKACVRKRYEALADKILEYIKEDAYLLELAKDFLY